MEKTLWDYINIQGKDDIAIFFSGTKKETGRMKYDKIIKHLLPILNEELKEFLGTEVKQKMEACKTPQEIVELDIQAFPASMRDRCLQFVEKQKGLNLPEQTYLFRDIYNSVANTLTNSIVQMALHYRQKLGEGKQTKIVNPHNGQPFNKQ